MKRLYSLLLVIALAGTLFLSTTQAQDSNDPPQVSSSYREVVKKVLPAVVSIETEFDRPKAALPRQFEWPDRLKKFFGEDWLDQDWFKNPWLDRFERKQSSSKARGTGSGFVIDANGVIVTNHHVIAGASKVRVRFQDGTTYTTTDIKSDPATDLAVLRIDPKKALPTLSWAKTGDLEIGDKVLAVGAPFGLAGSVTHGIVSGSHRAPGMNLYEDFIQTDAAINPGNSGGPLVDLHGNVVGVNSAIKTRTGSFQGVGLAISSDLAQQVLRQLLDKGVVRRGYLGATIRDLTPEKAEKLGIKKGVEIVEVMDGSPAKEAGLQKGDVITRVNDKPIQSTRELRYLVVGLPLDREATIHLFRDGKKKALPVKVKEQPQDMRRLMGQKAPWRIESLQASKGNRTNLERMGLVLEGSPAELARLLMFDLFEGFGRTFYEDWAEEEGKGALIKKVEKGGLADLVGLKPGMWIVKVNDQRVTSEEEARKAIENGSLQDGISLVARDIDGGAHQVKLRVSMD